MFRHCKHRVVILDKVLSTADRGPISEITTVMLPMDPRLCEDDQVTSSSYYNIF
jgi:hypothetical protein